MCDNVHLKIFRDLQSVPLFNEVISAVCASRKLNIAEKAFSIYLKFKHTLCNTQNLHCRGLFFFFIFFFKPHALDPTQFLLDFRSSLLLAQKKEEDRNTHLSRCLHVYHISTLQDTH